MHPRRAVLQFELVPVLEGLGEFLLVADQQDALQLAAEVLQLLDHAEAADAVEAAEALVDDDALDGAVLATGVLADAQREADRDAELLAAAEEGHEDRRRPAGAVDALEFERLAIAAVVVADD